MSSPAHLQPIRAPDRWANALPWPRYLLPTLVALVVIAILWLSLLPARRMQLDVGGADTGDLIYLRGFYHREQAERNNPAARTYRWARGDAQLLLPSGHNGASIVSALLYGAPQPDGQALDLRLHTGPFALHFAVPEQPRAYHLLIPAAAAGNDGIVRLELESSTVTPPGDDRSLAIAFDRLALRPLVEQGGPAPALLSVELLLVALLAVILWANAAPSGAIAAGALAISLLLGLLNLGARAWISLGVWPLAAVAATLGAASLLARMRMPRSATPEARFARRLWLIGLIGLGLRLVGVTAPGFAFHDLDIQSIMLGRVVGGQVYLFETAHEFAGGQTFYPSGPYLLALPLLLLNPAPAFALHMGVALADACAPVLLALLARELGLGRRAALLAAFSLTVLPINLTALWWGFFTNIVGQVLLLLLLWLLLRYTRQPGGRAAALLFVSLSMVLVSHVGVLILTGTAGALTLGLAWLRPRPSAYAWRGLLLVGLSALGFLSLGYLSVVAAPMLGSAQGVLLSDGRLSAEQLREGRAYLLRILPVAIWRGVGTLPFLLLLPGLALIWAGAQRPLARAVLAGWLLSPLLYLVVEYFYLVQVRYLYFLAPLSCLAFGAVLARLWPSKPGRLVAISALVLIAWLGTSLWLNGALIGIKMSLVPLTH